MEIRRITTKELEQVKELFVSVFCQEPWNDDWSDENQLNLYLTELLDTKNALCFGLYDKEQLVALSLDRVKHWYEGNEYYMDEFCVDSSLQHQGLAKLFISLLEEELSKREIIHLFLLTDSDVPAYSFYKKLGFHELEKNVAFTKKIEPYILSRANQQEAKLVFDLVLSRMKWMDEKGIQHWNVWEYDQIFPLSYYEEKCEEKELFVLKKQNEVVCGCVLEEKEGYIYISHLVSKESGYGSICLHKIEEYAKQKQISFLRLDSSESLVSYYAKFGFHPISTIQEGPYIGIVQEKKI